LFSNLILHSVKKHIYLDMTIEKYVLDKNPFATTEAVGHVYTVCPQGTVIGGCVESYKGSDSPNSKCAVDGVVFRHVIESALFVTKSSTPEKLCSVLQLPT